MSADLLEIMEKIAFGHAYRSPVTMVMSPYAFAVWETERKFYGRDWRRVKREVRKATDRVKKEQRGKPQGIDRSPNNWWRNSVLP